MFLSSILSEVLASVPIMYRVGALFALIASPVLLKKCRYITEMRGVCLCVRVCVSLWVRLDSGGGKVTYLSYETCVHQKGFIELCQKLLTYSWSCAHFAGQSDLALQGRQPNARGHWPTWTGCGHLCPTANSPLRCYQPEIWAAEDAVTFFLVPSRINLNLV